MKSLPLVGFFAFFYKKDKINIIKIFFMISNDYQEENQSGIEQMLRDYAGSGLTRTLKSLLNTIRENEWVIDFNIAFYEAMINDKIEIVKYLVSQDDILETLDFDSYDTMEALCSYDAIEVFQFLCLDKTNPHRINMFNHDCTGLHYAIMNNSEAIIHEYLKFPQKISQEVWIDSLCFLAKNNHVEKVKLMFDKRDSSKNDEQLHHKMLIEAIKNASHDMISYFLFDKQIPFSERLKNHLINESKSVPACLDVLHLLEKRELLTHLAKTLPENNNISKKLKI